jgi:hypothetical protein
MRTNHHRVEKHSGDVVGDFGAGGTQPKRLHVVVDIAPGRGTGYMVFAIVLSETESSINVVVDGVAQTDGFGGLDKDNEVALEETAACGGGGPSWRRRRRRRRRGEEDRSLDAPDMDPDLFDNVVFLPWVENLSLETTVQNKTRNARTNGSSVMRLMLTSEWSSSVL